MYHLQSSTRLFVLAIAVTILYVSCLFAVGNEMNTAEQLTTGISERILNRNNDIPHGRQQTNAPRISPVASPAATSKANPVTSPITSPAASPTISPIATPEATPEATPVASPVASPIASPISNPKANPMKSPIASPTVSFTASPMRMSPINSPPVNSQTSSPTSSPTSKPIAGDAAIQNPTTRRSVAMESVFVAGACTFLIVGVYATRKYTNKRKQETTNDIEELPSDDSW